jgi:periplasmic protein TonB
MYRPVKSAPLLHLPGRKAGLDAETLGMPGVSTARLLVARRIFAAPPSKDAWAWRRRALARGSAFSLHAAVIAFLLVHPPVDVLPPTPPIAVDLVMAPPPPAKAPSPSQASPQENAQGRVSVSGDDPDRAAGRPPAPEAKPSEVPTPEPAPANRAAPARELASQGMPPAPEAPDAAAAPAADTPPRETVASLEPPPVPDLKPSPPPNPPATNAEPSPRKPPAKASDTSNELQRGQGGGDRYLDKVRQDIDRNRIYPPEARSLGISGTAQYAIFIDRQGRLLRLRLLQSSGADLLDKAGMQMIQHSAPFQPPPQELKGNEVRLVVMLHIGP